MTTFLRAALILFAPWVPMVFILWAFGPEPWPCFFAGAYVGWLCTFAAHRGHMRRLKALEHALAATPLP